jgi:phosphatidylglycerol lysyltransferase
MSDSIDRLDEARALILAYGWNSTAYQLLNPGFALWFSRAGDAMAGYVDRAGVRVVGGAPVCARERLGEVVHELESDAADAGLRVCYFGAEGRLGELLRDSPSHAPILLGAQPVWDPHGWEAMVLANASLRAQLNRASNKGVRVSEWPRERAFGNAELHRCLTEWLGTRGLPPLHFLVEPETLQRESDRRIFVAERNGMAIGFVVTSPVPLRNGWLFEQFVRGRNAVNGTAELMIDAAMRALAESGAKYVTLGLAPLSTRAAAASENPLWLRVLLAWMRAHGRRFYNFAGLERFKAKFRPDSWEPVYAIVNAPSVPPRVLYAIAAAFSAGSPITLLIRGLGRAARQETETLRKLIKRRQ